MRTIEWRNGTVITIDQCKLPHETSLIKLTNAEEVAEAIKTMKIRGAPLLGATAAYALALAAYHSKARTRKELIDDLEKASKIIRETRPTAVNLFWAIDKIMGKVEDFSGDTKSLIALVVSEAQRIADKDAEANGLIG